MGTEKTLTSQAREAVGECDCLIGAVRMTKSFTDKPCYQAYKPAAVREVLTQHPEHSVAAVLLSGDTGFYSGAKRMINEFDDMELEVIPGISSVSYLASRLGTSWEDARLISLHGRKQNFIYGILHSEKAFLLLGKGCGEEICRKIKEYELYDLKFHIGRYLSYEEETIITRTGVEIVPEDFDDLAAAMVENPHVRGRVNSHIPDEEFIRGKVPMTKEEVRTISIARLDLRKKSVLYDIGAGTGSIGIEAALSGEQIKVYAIEKSPEALELIRENRKKFYADNLDVIAGTAPEALADLEIPTHAFIGGSSGNLKEIITCLKQKNPQVRLVINAISLKTVKEVMEAVEDGLLKSPEIQQVFAARAKMVGSHPMMKGQNPVYIISE